MIPTKEVNANPAGMVISCDQRASFGLRANRAKSGSLTMRVAKLAIALMIPETMPHANLEPWATPGWCTIGPIPCALTMAQMKKEIPAVGTTKALTVNKCRILCTGNQIAGSEQSQKMKNERKSLVFVPELGIPLWRWVYDGQIASIMSVTHSPPIQA
jgi:hypothetical protein